MSHNSDEPLTVSNNNSVIVTRPDELIHNDYSDIPMVYLPKNRINWSQTSQAQEEALATTPIHSTADLDNLQEGEVVV